MEHEFIALCVVVAVEHGVDLSLVESSGHRVAGTVLIGGSAFVLVHAHQFHGLAHERFAKSCGLHGVEERHLHVKLTQEEVAGGDAHVGHTPKHARVAGNHFQCVALVAVGIGHRGVVLGGRAAHGEFEARVTCHKIVAQRAVGQHVVPNVILVLVGFQLEVLEVVFDGVVHDDHLGHKLYAIASCPVAVLRGHGVPHWPSAEVVR